jgi:hypothetical protein
VNWRLFRWVWQLEAPLHVGMPPSGSLNRCRLYVPARALWGALTAEVARRAGNDFPSYAGGWAGHPGDARLTYLYPAEDSRVSGARGFRGMSPARVSSGSVRTTRTARSSPTE